VKILKKILSVVLGVALLLWVIKDVDLKSLSDALIDVDIVLALMVIPIIILNLVARAFRWRIILGRTKKNFAFFHFIMA
jgi:uncharacterized membrane protein YbhN (UPF0104 family)